MQNVNVNVKHRECLRDHPRQRLMIKCLTNIQIELEFGNVGLLRRGGKPEYPEKNLSEQGREPTTNSTHI